jgi:hypothetical protein
MIAGFISPDDKRWRRYLDANWHDFYHLPEYVRLCAQNEGGTPTAFYAETNGASFLVPLVILPLPESLNVPREWKDCVSPYGYSTPLISSTQEQFPAFLDAFMQTAKNQRIVTAFLRLHPFYDLNKEVLSRVGQLVHHGQTVYLDLSESDEKFWPQVRRNHKQNIHRLQQQGFRISLDDWSLLDEFAVMYRSTMARVNAVTCLYDQKYFAQLKETLNSSIHLCSVFSPNGHPAAGGIFVEMGGVVHYHLSATAAEFLSLGPNKLIVSFMRTWARQRMNKVIHLGGGVGGAYDSLFHFKAGFSNARADFYTCRIIVDRHNYEKLALADNSNVDANKIGQPSFFPAYRRFTSQSAHLPYEDATGQTTPGLAIAPSEPGG